MNKKYLVIIPFIVLLVVSGVLFFVCYDKTEEIANYIKGEEHTAILEQVTNQESINIRLNNISNEKKYTMKDAYVELNPYKISPLSAIIIFNTNREEEIEVYINDKFATKMEAVKKHIIPIYGLYEDYENKVKLVNNGVEVEYTIKTEKSNIKYPLNVEYKSEAVNND